MTASATSAATSRLRARRRLPVPSPPRPDSLSGRCMSPRAISIAGTTPNATDVSVAAAIANSSRWPSRPTAAPSSRGSGTGDAATSARTATIASPTPNRTHEGEQNALRDELANQPSPAGANGGAHGHLALAYRRARQQQARDVRAGNQEQKRRGAEQGEERRTKIAFDLVRGCAATDASRSECPEGGDPYDRVRCLRGRNR